MPTSEPSSLVRNLRSRSLVVHRFISIVLILGLMLQGVPLVSAQERIPDTPEEAPTAESEGPAIMSDSVADALDLNPLTAPSISFGASDSRGYAVFSTPASEFPIEEVKGNSSYLVMSSGCTSLALTPNQSESLSCSLNGLNNSQGRDMVQMSLTLNVPPVAKSWFVDWKFFSEEFPEWVGSQYNDAFLIEQGSSNFTINGPNIYAPNNQAHYYGRLITVNGVGPIGVTRANAYGTTYDGATNMLSTSGPVPPGATTITLIFTIMDLGDSIYDSTVFLDNFRFSQDIPTIPPTKPKEICGNGIDDNLDGQIDEACNQVPTVNAGGPYSGSEGAPITLNGSASDPNPGDSLTANWSYVVGPDVDPGATCSFGDAQSLSPTLTCTDDGTYYATLTVSDGKDTPVSDDAHVTISNAAPTASFTASSQIDENSPITLQLSTPSDPSSVDTTAGFRYAFDCGTGYGTASSTASASCTTTDMSC